MRVFFFDVFIFKEKYECSKSPHNVPKIPKLLLTGGKLGEFKNKIAEPLAIQALRAD